MAQAFPAGAASGYHLFLASVGPPPLSNPPLLAASTPDFPCPAFSGERFPGIQLKIPATLPVPRF